MKILHIETSVKTCSVAISNQGRLIDTIESHPDGFEHSESLNIFIESILSKNGITLSDLVAISVGSGPGSYTGLRIGTATAKGFCYALNIPMIAIDSLSIMMNKFAQKYQTDLFDYYIPMIDARRMEVYDAIYDSDLNLISKPTARIIEENSFQQLSGKILLFGEGADKLNNVNFKNDVTIQPNFKTSASGMCREVYEKFQAKDFEDLAYFSPIYLKEFQPG